MVWTTCSIRGERKRARQIDERRAIEKFRSHLLNDHGAIQMILPLAEDCTDVTEWRGVKFCCRLSSNC
jgi:hypothetical protein